MTIRASQVIPVYPMSEDLQPGDIFLVQQAVDDQHKAYEKDGFLPLDNHLERIDPLGYPAFYDQSFFNGVQPPPALPRGWLNPGQEKSFAAAPAAAFPAYSFSVNTGAAFSGALPVQGVPVGLTMLGTASANGSVMLKDARTYGVGIASLYTDVLQWADQNQSFLQNYGEDEGVNYLRVISRVYLVGKVNVSLDAGSLFSGGGSVGVPKPVDLPLLQAKTAAGGGTKATVAEAYQTGVNSLTNSLAGLAPKANSAAAAGAAVAGVAPGATLKVVSASARSVSIDETFDRPVVIGYLGFDMAILEDGSLGPPIPTHAVLNNQKLPPASPAKPYSRSLAVSQSQIYFLVKELSEDNPRAKAVVDRWNEIAGKALPGTYPVTLLEVTQGGDIMPNEAAGTPFTTTDDKVEDFVIYQAQLVQTADLLRRKITDKQDAKQPVDSNDITQLGLAENELQRLGESSRPLIEQARAAARILFN